MSTPDDTVTIEVITSKSPRLAEVLALYKADSGTLGFFPIGAFEAKAVDGYILVAVQGNRAIGYLLYNMTRLDAVIVHLCVGREHRGTGVAERLFERLRREIPTDCPIRLTCRRDYVDATRLWQRLGFTVVTHRTGRGADKAELFVWRWESGSERPLLQVVNRRRVEDRKPAVIDANVYFDLIDPENATGKESQLLAQEWLDELVEFVRSPELINEIYRTADLERRNRALGHLGGYPEVSWSREDFERVHSQLCALLPPAETDQDHSDRRHIAYTVAAKVPYFITRDAVLLGYSDDIRRAFGTEVLDPVDFVLSLDEGRNATDYQPFRLAATQIVSRRVSAAERENIALEFQRFPQRETKASWFDRLTQVLGDRPASDVHALHMPDGERLVVYATRSVSPGGMEIPLLRAKGQKTALTALRHVLMSVVIRASERGCRLVTCTDAGSPPIEEALAEAGFAPRGDGTWVRALIPDILTRPQLLDLLEADPLLAELTRSLPSEPRIIDYERLFWPLKVVGESVPCFILSIKPYWARALFDHALTGELFHAPVELACGLENVFYSGSSLKALRGARARVLWYVSEGGNDPRAKSVRACSIIDDGSFAPARELFNRFKRLGVYQWQQVLETANGKAANPITALRFSHTELFRNPIDWKSFQSILEARVGRRNPMAGPVRVREEVFFDLYTRGTGRGPAA